MRNVRIAELKARLSEHVRYVRRGNVVTILDRDTPVAQLVPLDHIAPLAIRKPAPGSPKLKDVRIPRTARAKRDPLETLLEDRERGR